MNHAFFSTASKFEELQISAGRSSQMGPGCPRLLHRYYSSSLNRAHSSHAVFLVQARTLWNITLRVTGAYTRRRLNLPHNYRCELDESTILRIMQFPRQLQSSKSYKSPRSDQEEYYCTLCGANGKPTTWFPLEEFVQKLQTHSFPLIFSMLWFFWISTPYIVIFCKFPRECKFLFPLSYSTFNSQLKR